MQQKEVSNNKLALANPSSLGLACFGISVFMLAAYFVGAIPGAAVVSTALFVGLIGMLAAGAGAYRRGDTFEATWMSAYGLFWGAVAFYLWFFAGKTSAANDLAWMAIPWGIFTGYMFVSSLRSKSLLISLQLILFFILFLFVWMHGIFHVPAGLTVASIAGFLTAIVAGIEAFLVSWATTDAESGALTRIGLRASRQPHAMQPAR
jgi:uncharacterized protein